MTEFRDELCKEFYIDRDEVRLVVADMAPKILPILPDKLIEKSERRYFDKYSEYANYIKLPKKKKVVVHELQKVEFESKKNVQKKVWKTNYILLDERGVKVFESHNKQEAIKKSKELSEKMNSSINIEEGKKLMSGDPSIGKTKMVYKDVKKDAYTYILFGEQPE
jgi:uncharacterized membrane protein